MRGYRRALNVPPEIAAVKQPVLRSSLEDYTSRVARDYAIQRRLGDIKSNIEFEKKRMRMAEKETPYSAGIGLVNVGLEGLNAWNKYQQAKEIAEEKRLMADLIDAIASELARNRNMFTSEKYIFDKAIQPIGGAQ